MLIMSTRWCWYLVSSDASEAFIWRWPHNKEDIVVTYRETTTTELGKDWKNQLTAFWWKSLKIGEVTVAVRLQFGKLADVEIKDCMGNLDFCMGNLDFSNNSQWLSNNSLVLIGVFDDMIEKVYIRRIKIARRELDVKLSILSLYFIFPVCNQKCHRLHLIDPA